MKILYLTVDRSQNITSHFGWFQKQLKNMNGSLVSTKFVYRGTNGLTTRQFGEDCLSKKIKSPEYITPELIDRKYDFIVTDSLFAFPNDEWKRIKIPKAVILEDMHETIPRMQIDLINDYNINVVFYRYKYAMNKLFSDTLKNKDCFWLPHSVPFLEFQKYNIPYNSRNNRVIFTGASSSYYPFRKYVIDTFNKESYFYYVKSTKRRDGSCPFGENYMKLLGDSRIHITCGSKLEYPVCKFFEIPASGCLLISPWFKELNELGFVSEHNMVAVNQRDVRTKLEYYLKNTNEAIKIVDNSIKLIKEKHTTEIRTKQFFNCLSRYISGSNVFQNINDEFNNEV